jgi:glutaredoxin
MADPQSAITKIKTAPKDTYVIFYVKECPYCQNALALLEKSGVNCKGYNIHDIKGDMLALLSVLNTNANEIGFDKGHKTKPIIFYNGKFIGGYTELANILK